jgi:uncharacterized protein (DUF4415 family)
LLSPEPSPAAPLEPAATAAPAFPVEPDDVEQAAPSAPKAKLRHPTQAKNHARRGRPPGKKAGEGANKEKVTLRLGKELMDEYRDWSWDEHCQLGELVERALIQYRSRRIRQQSQ